jgi:hypothetical protein
MVIHFDMDLVEPGFFNIQVLLDQGVFLGFFDDKGGRTDIIIPLAQEFGKDDIAFIVQAEITQVFIALLHGNLEFAFLQEFEFIIKKQGGHQVQLPVAAVDFENPDFFLSSL